MRSTVTTFMLLGALTLASAFAWAQPVQSPPENTAALDESARREQAKTLFEKGVSLYRDEHYKEALNYFIGAQNLYPNTTLTFNIARTCERIHDAPCALRYYREYRRKAQNAKDLDEVDRHIASMEHEVASKGVQQVTLFSKPEGALLLVDGVEKGSTPWTGELTPGQHTALIKQAGFSDLQVAFLVEAAHAADWTYQLRPVSTPEQVPESALPAAKEVQPVPAQMQPQIAPARPQAAPAPIVQERHAKVRPWTWVALGSGAVALGTAGILESVRASREGDVRDKATQLDRTAAYESMKDYQKAARITAGAGLTLTIVGVTLLTFDLTRHTNKPATVTASCAGADCRFAVSGAW